FFFSSRRRHTRWPRDWSSACALPIFGLARRPAVLGIDLEGDLAVLELDLDVAAAHQLAEQDLVGQRLLDVLLDDPRQGTGAVERSEERRVGKGGEWRASRARAEQEVG